MYLSYSIFQPPIVSLHEAVLEARSLEAKLKLSYMYLSYSIFQPPIVILHATVLEARSLEAKDADGKTNEP